MAFEIFFFYYYYYFKLVYQEVHETSLLDFYGFFHLTSGWNTLASLASNCP